MNKEVSLVILIEVKPGNGFKQVNLYNKIKPFVHAEHGCLKYELSAVAGSDVDFVLIERWASEEALAAHDVAAHMLAADALSPSFRAGPAKVFVLKDL